MGKISSQCKWCGQRIDRIDFCNSACENNYNTYKDNMKAIDMFEVVKKDEKIINLKLKNKCKKRIQ